MKKFLRLLTLMLTIVVMILASSCSCSQEQEPVQPVNPTPVEPTPTEPTVVSKEYKLHDWYASFETGLPKLTLTEKNYTTTTFPVPTRENFTFNGWYIGEEKVADENGKSLMTEELFNSESKDIAAKWKANETYRYKVLVVYLTNISGYIVDRDYTRLQVNHTMSESEITFCNLATDNLKVVLDDMLDGLINFQVDNYFTAQPVVLNGMYGADLIPAESISEVENKLDEYESVFTIYSLGGDYFLDEIDDGRIMGAAIKKYASVSLDAYRYTLANENLTFEQANEYLKQNKKMNWESTYSKFFETFTHELAHTIEIKYNLYDFHTATNNCTKVVNYTKQRSYLLNKMYFLNAITDINGNQIGIPFNFWKYEPITITISNQNLDGLAIYGTICDAFSGKCSSGTNLDFMFVKETDVTLIAEPYEGYKFVKWSDGVESAKRTFKKITDNITVTAIFEKI